MVLDVQTVHLDLLILEKKYDILKVYRFFYMLGNLEPEETVENQSIIDQLARLINKLEWTTDDEISVELGGTQISGIDVGEEYNKKWQSPIGTRKYNKDAFIIIKNQTRRDLSKSQPMDREHKPHHLKTDKEINSEIKEQDDKLKYDTYSK